MYHVHWAMVRTRKSTRVAYRAIANGRPGYLAASSFILEPGVRLKRPHESCLFDALEIQMARQLKPIIGDIIDAIRIILHAPLDGLIEFLADANGGENYAELIREVLAQEPIIAFPLGRIRCCNRSLITLQAQNRTGKGSGESIDDG